VNEPTTETTVRAPSPAPHRFVVLVPGLRLVTLSNGPQFKPFMKHSIKKKQQKLVGDALDARSKVCPFTPPMVVTITRCAPGRMDSDNAVSAAKFVRDRVAQWLGINDKREDLVEYVVKQEKTSKGVYFVKIEFTPRTSCSA
jgi:hypothetical protein